MAFQSFIREQGKEDSAKSKPETFLWVHVNACTSRSHTNMTPGLWMGGIRCSKTPGVEEVVK